jgi:hypothetical protein
MHCHYLLRYMWWHWWGPKISANDINNFLILWFYLQVYDKKPLKVKNIGIWLRYVSRSGNHNMYREYRDLTAAGAVTQCCKSFEK